MSLSPLFASLVLACLAGAASAASVCSSDDNPPPHAVVERFLPDSCAACWRRSTPAGDRSAFGIDWIVPGADSDAPLAAAALPEAVIRLATLGYTIEKPRPDFWKWRYEVPTPAAGRLRLAQGPAVNGYVGVSMAWTPRPGDTRPMDAWLLLVEEVPAGTDGTPVPRRLVRAAFSVPHVVAGKAGWNERRAMHIPEGADHGRLRLVGWMADPRGEMVAVAASRCAP